jgi:hypothetical protein
MSNRPGTPNILKNDKAGKSLFFAVDQVEE